MIDSQYRLSDAQYLSLHLLGNLILGLTLEYLRQVAQISKRTWMLCSQITQSFRVYLSSKMLSERILAKNDLMCGIVIKKYVLSF